MALRDHSLDTKIVSAAFEEFLDKGYMGASLRKISEKAGATVGAIRTRYKSKDDLFLSMLKPFLDEIEAAFQNIKSDYYSGTDSNILLQLKASMKNESETILHLIFTHYDEAVMLFYRSAGSSLEHYLDVLIENKIAESVTFFRSFGYTDIDEKLLGLLISVQFNSYRQIIINCHDRQTAEKYMNTLMIYHSAGWVSLFRSMDHIQEDKCNEI
ncbi:MAG: TetR/AcrR family transcriptional regulator [Bacillota bacterium]|nr:TetR/AcrR family transcriptional regulator [Bacillota bacterium]